MTDAQRAHLRILEQVRPPIHTHEAVLRSGEGGVHAQAVMVKGVGYPSVADAARALRKSRSTIRRWIGEGQGHYA